MLSQEENNKTNGVKCIFGPLKYLVGFKKISEMEIQAHYTVAPSLEKLPCIFVFKRRHTELKTLLCGFLLGGFCVFNQ